MVDELDASAETISSVNTIVNTDGRIKAYNTDYIAITKLLNDHQVSRELVFALRGSGGMAKAVACALKDAAFKHGTIVAKNAFSGTKLADLYRYDWRTDLGRLPNAMNGF